MKSFILASLAASTLALSEIESSFLSFISEYERNYGTLEEYGFRLSQFVRAHREIEEHNAKETSWKLGHNQFSDWTIEEYEALLTYRPHDEEEFNANLELFPEVLGGARPIDWRNKGKVQKIKDQGQCGSCWTFSATSAIESMWAIKHGNLGSYAEQVLVDCDTRSYGCNGGNQSTAYNYFKSHNEVNESDYRYTARDGKCKYSSVPHTKVSTTGYKTVARNSPDQMKAALSNNPLSVSLHANNSFERYRNGIFNDTSCGTRMNHAVNVVGWGQSGNTDYWIMRNSWGRTWGESGYMRVQIHAGSGICGIQQEAQYPTV